MTATEHVDEYPCCTTSTVISTERVGDRDLLVTLTKEVNVEPDPGDHITIETPAGRRSYSLCGPVGADTWTILVRCDGGGRGGSKWLHENVGVDVPLEVRGPFSAFHFDRSINPNLFVAGGIGITPLISMAADAQRAGSDYQLVHFAQTTKESAAIVSKLAPWIPADRLTVITDTFRSTCDWEGILRNRIAEAGRVYCCGPDSLMTYVTKESESMTTPISIERFGSDLTTDATAPTTGDHSGFKVVLARSGLELDVAPGQSILDAVEGAGLIVACSCCEGICGTCEVDVVGGTPEHLDQVLTPQERAAGDRILICVSRSLTPTLTLDL